MRGSKEGNFAPRCGTMTLWSAALLTFLPDTASRLLRRSVPEAPGVSGELTPAPATSVTGTMPVNHTGGSRECRFTFR